MKHPHSFYYHDGYRVNVADKVGGGDAFLAAFLSKSLDRSPPEEVLDYANKLAALVVTYIGACPDYNITEVNNLTPLKIKT